MLVERLVIGEQIPAELPLVAVETYRVDLVRRFLNNGGRSWSIDQRQRRHVAKEKGEHVVGDL